MSGVDGCEKQSRENGVSGKQGVAGVWGGLAELISQLVIVVQAEDVVLGRAPL